MSATVVLLLNSSPRPVSAAEPGDAALEQRFTNAVQPFLRDYCLGCHGRERQEARLDLTGYSNADAVASNLGTWQQVRERLEADEMPPEDAPRRPTVSEREAVLTWLRDLRGREARRQAGDPGPVLARRLSNAEFDYTIHDLTGVDIRATREFPVDPANEAGFDNSGESLTMSPALLKKYLAAARLIAGHLVLKPEGFVFAPHPVVAETDRDKYCVQRIVDFYRRFRLDYADYFLAAWQFQHRRELDRPGVTLAQLASEAGLSPRYLATIWELLQLPGEVTGPLGEVLTQWRSLPADVARQDEARRICARIRDEVLRLREAYTPSVDRLRVRGISDGSQPLVLWHNRTRAAQRRQVAVERLAPEMLANEQAKQDLEKFCRVFPDTFYVLDRGPYFDPKAAGQGRLLTAGFHLMQGYFRDDQPLYELVLDDEQQRELDALWQELDFITGAPQRQYKDFIFFERAEPPQFIGEAAFDFARSEDNDATSVAKMDQLAGAYLAKARRHDASDTAIAAIETYFASMSASIRWVEQARLAAEPSHLTALLQLAERAYRRPLTSTDREDLLAFYHRLRVEEGLHHEDALRDTLVSVLMSPHFCYRFEPAVTGASAQPLSDYSLASRLSYFLWSSLPDEPLLARAAAGDLHQPDVLIAQARRMLRDPRIQRLATEFGGQWLEFRRFEEHNSVDRERFPTFTNELRRAMYEEPIRFLADVASQDGSVLDLLYADHTFVNPLLARHYGIPVPPADPAEWVRVAGAGQYGRGGLLPMAVFLTANSPGLRTSPVKRGYWVVRRLLGEHIPPPPPAVPELPKDEAQPGELTLPQLLARHRENKSCAACHERFDSIGLVFEGYGPVGERRQQDLGGRSIATQAIFPDGNPREGLEGLRQYLRAQRQQDFVDNLCRKLFSYALGRGLLLSDEPTIDNMRSRLAAEGHRFGVLVEMIVTSPQFRNQRAEVTR